MKKIKTTLILIVIAVTFEGCVFSMEQYWKNQMAKCKALCAPAAYSWSKNNHDNSTCTCVGN